MNANMKKIGQAALGVWCALTSFASPFWLVLAFLCLTGKIYQYDATMDEGTAGILGAVCFVVWVLAVLWPDIVLLKNLWKKHPKYLFAAIGVMALLAVSAAGLCRFDIAAFWTEPGGMMGRNLWTESIGS